ncbi:hypothetical protein [Flavobacterium psychrotrophum]|uniref:hypothetical protein n=1 Tax=Flavobacterium psychrotrophum TaxID=2294119 RepID=UPI000E3181FD|nr:hypothetical protein [Flavobacterium psychrotrophum]
MIQKKLKKPHWQINFKDLPTIPLAKRWLKDNSGTQEHIITRKMFEGKPITDNEKNILRELKFFYAMLYHELESFEYQKLTREELLDFKNYISYAFNYIPYLLNKTEVIQLYRVSKNRNGDNITKTKYLTYPPEHLVRKMDKYNRANTPNTTVFYGSESIDTAINELKPEVGEIITISIWKPIHEKYILNAFHVSHTEKGYGKNSISTYALNFFEKYKESWQTELIDFIEPYFHLLGREYEKKISHHLEYVVSAIFSEQILQKPLTPKHMDLHCIIYPSVGNEYLTSNLAIRKDIFRNNFELFKAIELEITETHYDNINKDFSNKINVVNYKNYKETSTFSGGNIIW